MMAKIVMMTKPRNFRGAFLALTLTVLAGQAHGNTWEYVGVLGSGSSAIAVLREARTQAKQFLRIDERLPGENLIVQSIARNHVEVMNPRTHERLLITSQGSRSSEGAAVDPRAYSPKILSAADYERARKAVDPLDPAGSERRFQEVYQMAQDLVASGDITVEEANAVLAEDYDANQFLERYDSLSRGTSANHGVSSSRD